LVHSTGAFVYYSDSVTSPPLSLDFELYSGTGFSDDETTDFFSTGSNAINYFRVSTDKAWHLDAKLIKNISTASGVYNNVQDAEYTRFDTQSGGIVYLPINEVSRDFKIVFDNSSPIIYSIDWGSYTRTVSSSLVCNSGGTNAVTQALKNIAKYKDDVQTSLVDLDSTDIESSLVNKIKFFMGFLSFSLSDTGNVFSVYLPIGSNLSLSGVSLTIPKTGYSPTNTGALNYFAPVTVGNNKTVVDYIIFIVGLLAYFSGVFTVVYFLVFYIGVFLLSAIQKMFSSVTFNFLGKDDESIS